MWKDAVVVRARALGTRGLARTCYTRLGRGRVKVLILPVPMPCAWTWGGSRGYASTRKDWVGDGSGAPPPS